MKSTSVYRTQVKTFSVALSLNVDWRYLRILPAYRNLVANKVRKDTADAVRALRAQKQAFPLPPRQGIATPMHLH